MSLIKEVMMRPWGVEKRVRPTTWNPWVRTVAWYPFNTDYADVTWNSPTGTQNSTLIGSYQWVNCLNLNSSFVTISWIDNLGNATAYTMSVWIYTTGTFVIEYYQNWSWWGSWFLSHTSQQWYLRWWNPDDIESNINAISGGRHHVVQTWVVWWPWMWYIDKVGTTKKATLTAWPYNNSTTLYLGKDAIWNQYSGWFISNLIIERRARTDMDVTNYYNQTKSIYWIS